MFEDGSLEPALKAKRSSCAVLGMVREAGVRALREQRTEGRTVNKGQKGGIICPLTHIQEESKSYKTLNIVGHICKNVKRFLWTPMVKNLVAPNFQNGRGVFDGGGPPLLVYTNKVASGEGGSSISSLMKSQ